MCSSDLLLLLLFLFMLFFFQVRTTEVAMVTRFGRYSRAVEPGLNWRLPLPIEKVYRFDKRLQTFEKKFEATLTKDQKNLLCMVFVGWRIAQPRPFLESFNGDTVKAEASLENVVRNAKNMVLGRHNFTELVTANPSEMKLDRKSTRLNSSH